MGQTGDRQVTHRWQTGDRQVILIASPVLMYTWGADSLMSSLQEVVDLDEPVRPQAVVSG